MEHKECDTRAPILLAMYRINMEFSCDTVSTHLYHICYTLF